MITLDPADYTVTLAEGEPVPPLPPLLHCLCPEHTGTDRRHVCGEPCPHYRPLRAATLEDRDRGIACRCPATTLAALDDKPPAGRHRDPGEVCFAPVDVVADNRFWRRILEDTAR